MDAFEILVIILAVTLATFLILAVVATIFVVQILQQVKRISAKAESAVNYAESATRTFASAVSPAFIAQTVITQLRKSFKKK